MCDNIFWCVSFYAFRCVSLSSTDPGESGSWSFGHHHFHISTMSILWHKWKLIKMEKIRNIASNWESVQPVCASPSSLPSPLLWQLSLSLSWLWQACPWRSAHSPYKSMTRRRTSALTITSVNIIITLWAWQFLCAIISVTPTWPGGSHCKFPSIATTIMCMTGRQDCTYSHPLMWGGWP